ncbi:MAG: hypothetical protein IPI48_17220 [bacterium]|nr:hypothetical protein [bacterium]
MSSTTKSPDTPADGALTPSLAPEHAELLVALDRMLTVGSYYPPGHEKYRQVAAAAHRAVVRAAGPQGIAAIEVNEPGLTMGPSFAAADSREAKRLHKLLMPLDVALLEIDTAASAEDLHAALLVLKKQQSELGSSRTYRTIEVTGLPASVRVTSRQLYVKMRHKLVGSGGTRPNIDAFDPNTIPDALLVATPDGQHLEREFLAVVRGIMTGADPTKLQRLHETPIDKITQALGEWIPDAAIRAMKDIIDRLAETNSDPMVLESLVGHAKKALDLTGDADLVELAFQRLRVEREVKGESRPLLEGRPKPKGVKRTPVVYTMTRAAGRAGGRGHGHREADRGPRRADQRRLPGHLLPDPGHGAFGRADRPCDAPHGDAGRQRALLAARPGRGARRAALGLPAGLERPHGGTGAHAPGADAPAAAGKAGLAVAGGLGRPAGQGAEGSGLAVPDQRHAAGHQVGR